MSLSSSQSLRRRKPRRRWRLETLGLRQTRVPLPSTKQNCKEKRLDWRLSSSSSKINLRTLNIIIVNRRALNLCSLKIQTQFWIMQTDKPTNSWREAVTNKGDKSCTSMDNHRLSSSTKRNLCTLLNTWWLLNSKRQLASSSKYLLRVNKTASSLWIT